MNWLVHMAWFYLPVILIAAVIDVMGTINDTVAASNYFHLQRLSYTKLLSL